MELTSKNNALFWVFDATNIREPLRTKVISRAKVLSTGKLVIVDKFFVDTTSIAHEPLDGQSAKYDQKCIYIYSEMLLSGSSMKNKYCENICKGI